MNDVKLANSPEGHEPIAIINAQEKYDTLKVHLSDINDSISKFTSYSYQGMKYNIVYFLCGDYKFLLAMLGLAAANSN